MLHGLEDCRILGVDDAFQSELRGGQLWKIACERLLLADSGLTMAAAGVLTQQNLLRLSA